MPQSPAYRPNVAAQDFARCQRGVAAPVVAIPGVGDDLVHPSRVAEAQRAVQFAAQGNTQRSLERSQVPPIRSEEHTSELQSLMRISYAVFCLKKKKQNKENKTHIQAL